MMNSLGLAAVSFTVTTDRSVSPRKLSSCFAAHLIETRTQSRRPRHMDDHPTRSGWLNKSTALSSCDAF